VEFTPITESEFQEIQWRGPRGSELAETIWNLELNAGFSTPCTWKHSTGQFLGPIKKDGTRTPTSYNRCSGITAAHNAFKTNFNDRHIRCRCTDGTLYVFRIA
jgi:hypothetical protein